MNKLWEKGRKAVFYMRVFSGYEAYYIRSRRLKRERRIRSIQEEKAIVAKIPDEVVLLQMRRLVEGMQNLNNQLERIETDIDEHFKPLEKGASMVLDMQLNKETKTMEMMKQFAVERAKEQMIANEKAKTESLTGLLKETRSKNPEAEEVAATKQAAQ